MEKRLDNWFFLKMIFFKLTFLFHLGTLSHTHSYAHREGETKRHRKGGREERVFPTSVKDALGYIRRS